MDRKATDQLLRKAHRLSERGRRQEAVALLESAISGDPQNAALYWGLGVAHQVGSDHEAALAALEKGNAVAPDNAAIQWKLGQLLFETGRHEEALGFVLKSLEEWPENAQVYALLGKIYVELSRFEEAKEALTNSRELSTANPDAIEGMADLYWMRGEDERVPGLLLAYIDDNPELASSHAFYADFLQYTEGDAAGSLPSYERALMLCEDETMLNWLRGFYSTSDYPGSIIQGYWDALVASGYLDIARRLVDENMTGAPKVLFEAMIEGENGRHERSRRILRAGLEKFPESDSIMQLLAIERLRQGRNLEAAQLIDCAIAIRGNLDQDVGYEAVSYIASTGQGQAERASTTLNGAVGQFGNDFWGALAYHWRELSRWQESLSACERFLESDPEYVYVLRYKAEALVGLGRYEKALGVYEKLSDLQPKNGKLLIEMAKVCARISEYDRAEALLQRAESETNLSRPQREEIAQLRLKVSSD
jgi:tetratricopeptide (TPR) repeat protein